MGMHFLVCYFVCFLFFFLLAFVNECKMRNQPLSRGDSAGPEQLLSGPGCSSVAEGRGSDPVRARLPCWPCTECDTGLVKDRCDVCGLTGAQRAGRWRLHMNPLLSRDSFLWQTICFVFSRAAGRIRFKVRRLAVMKNKTVLSVNSAWPRSAVGSLTPGSCTGLQRLTAPNVIRSI